jgi:molecular chaperone DnaK
MSDEDIDKAVREAQEYEAQDKKRKESIDARNDADSMVVQTEKALSEVGDKISDSEKSELQTEIDNVNAILERTKDKELSEDEVSELKAAQEKMMEKANGVFSKMYESMQGAAGAGAGAQGAGPDMSQFTNAGTSGDNGDGDNFAGDFREV